MTRTDDTLIANANQAIARVQMEDWSRRCAQCGATFYPADFHPSQATCSRACQMARYHQAKGHVPVGTTVAGTCTVCAQPFSYQQRKRPRIYCDTCRPTSHHKRDIPQQ
jgi:hypothetical protein